MKMISVEVIAAKLNVNEIASDELSSFISEYLYEKAKDIVTSLAKELAEENYNKEKAIKLWSRLTDEGAKLYKKSYGNIHGATVFNKAIKLEAAKYLESYYKEDVMNEAKVIIRRNKSKAKSKK